MEDCTKLLKRPLLEKIFYPGIKNGPGYGVENYDPKTKQRKLVKTFAEAMEIALFGNGSFDPIWVWFDNDGNIDHALTPEEIQRVRPC